MVATTAAQESRRASVRRDYAFGIQMAIGMLCINLVGFGPTLYLRPFFDTPAIPSYLYLHGAVGTAWFVLCAIQSLLIRNSAFRTHRRLGWVGLIIAALVLASGIYTSYNMVSRNVALGASSATDIALYVAVTTADLTAFVVFPGLVLTALLLRRRSGFHWRLIMLSSISILGPALARIASQLAEFPNPLPGAALLAAIGAICVHDLRTRDRVHMATAIGGGFTIALFLIAQIPGIGEIVVAGNLNQ